MKQDIKLLSVELKNLSRAEFIHTVEKRLRSGIKTKIFTPNPQILLRAQKSKETAVLFRKSDMNIPDGTGLLIAAKILGQKFKARLPGIDAAEDIMAIAEKSGYSVFLLGGKKGRGWRAAKELLNKFPQLNICGCHNGYFAKYGEENLRVRKAIAIAAPDILFVCLGSPAQEKWIIENMHYLPSVKLAMGLGGSIDVWSGYARRAPVAFRRCGLEWIWRKAIDPRRIGILVDIPKFLISVLDQKRRSA